MSKTLETLVGQLQEIDKKLGSENDKSIWHAKRADVLEKLVAHSESSAERTTWIEQFADTISAAAQVGEYAAGIDRLNDFSRKLKSDGASSDHLAYVAFRTMTAEHNVKMADPGAKYDELNKAYLDNLRQFIDAYPEANDSAEAMLQIALAAEFTGESKEALQWYARASKAFPNTEAGKKAGGALNRISLDGKPFLIGGNTLDGRTFKSSDLKDGPTVYHFWASWCDGCKADMRALKELQTKYAKNKLRVVGINLDKDPAKAASFLKENSYPWPHLNDKGGLDSQLAMSYGILTLPMTFVVDKNGKVVRTGVHWTDLDGIIQDLTR
jgi:thiol-disulfide isomerase/thioredoxin